MYVRDLSFYIRWFGGAEPPRVWGNPGPTHWQINGRGVTVRCRVGYYKRRHIAVSPRADITPLLVV